MELAASAGLMLGAAGLKAGFKVHLMPHPPSARYITACMENVLDRIFKQCKKLAWGTSMCMAVGYDLLVLAAKAVALPLWKKEASADAK